MISYMISLNISVTIIIYSIVYLYNTFVIWQLKNPFQWIIDIPTYQNESRFFILFACIFYQTILTFACYHSYKDKNGKSN